MKKLLTVFLFLIVLFPPSCFALVPGDLVITEIMKNPQAVSDTKGEWFEIYNSTNQTIDLRGLVIKDLGTNQFTIASSSAILAPPLGYLVLGRNNNPAENGNLTVDYLYSGFQLGNDTDEILILEETTEIDRVEYNDDPTWPDPDGASLMLLETSLDNNLGSNWTTATTSYGDGDLGTPGKKNFPTTTPTPTVTPTPTPSSTPTPTSTLTPSITPKITPTPTSSPYPFLWPIHRIPKVLKRDFLRFLKTSSNSGVLVFVNSYHPNNPDKSFGATANKSLDKQIANPNKIC